MESKLRHIFWGANLSDHLMFLLEKSRKTLPASEEPAEPSKPLAMLITRIENRRWKRESMEEIKLILQGITDELWLMEHVKRCEICQTELVLGVVRYLGTRCPWYLNIQNEMGFPEIYEDPFYKDCPKPSDYRMGGWPNENFDEGLRFVLDRIGWAEPKIKRIAQTATEYLEALINWKLTGEPPVADRIIWMYLPL